VSPADDHCRIDHKGHSSFRVSITLIIVFEQHFVKEGGRLQGRQGCEGPPAGDELLAFAGAGRIIAPVKPVGFGLVAGQTARAAARLF
jgi:hypothetical protein